MTPRIITAAQRATRRQQQPMRGLGDLVARVTNAVGIKPCLPCRTTRKDLLNRLVPFSTKSHAETTNPQPTSDHA